MKSFSCLAMAALLLGGCSTSSITPNDAESKVALPDSSTPTQYPQANAGFLGYHDDRAWLTPHGETEVGGAPIKGVVFGVLTPMKRTEYNTLIDDYGVRFRTQYKVQLHHDDGLAPWLDAYGNPLWKMAKTYVVYLGYLEIYKRNQDAPDSVIAKAGAAL
jgi:hypothetical protein